ncbi:MAG: SDR family NAD(P)-dependent oxidoreductase [Terrimicrobiaceae bacterium]
MKFFEGCTALITGASSGLGAEFARQLSPYARSLVLVARRNDRLEELAQELRGIHDGLDVKIYCADLGVEKQRVALVEWLKTEKIAVDFLINNAGLGDHGLFDSSDWKRVKAMLDVNIGALTHLTHLLVPSMLIGGRAAVLNVSSVAGFFPLPQMAVYSATKAYVTSFSEALSIELRSRGISVTALCPGPVSTEFFGIATREGEEDAASHFESFSAFVVTPQDVVAAGLRAVAKDRARVIPGPLLAAAVAVALVIPFFLVRRVLAWKADSL